jgi:zinc-dependent metalloproteinase lipoprotein
MKKIICLFTAALVIATTATAQTFQAKDATIISVPKQRCHTAEYLAEEQAKTPFINQEQLFENWLQPLIAKNKANNVARKVPVLNYKLPVIFHIIYSTATGVDPLINVDAGQIDQQILQLNKDYANKNNSPYSVAIHSGIQFALANTDPTGATLAEPGIERIDATTKGWTNPPYNAQGATSYFWTTIKTATIWDPNKYINIWVSDISATNIVGIATFPTGSPLAGLSAGETATNAGVVISYNSVGSVLQPSSVNNTKCGNNAYAQGRALTHELGHFFGLRHIWGDATCGTDYVADNPVHEQANYGQWKHPKTNTCGTADEMFENYMDYTDDNLMNTFTAGQVDRMQTVLLNSPRRNTLGTHGIATTDPLGSEQICFAECSGQIVELEKGNAGVYPRYHDISLTLMIENKSIDTANLIVTGTGTAIDGKDYTILTPKVHINNNQ